MDFEGVVINPIVDFSADFVGSFDPNCLSLKDVEDMLQSGVNVQDHRSISSFYETRHNANEETIAQSSSRFPTVDVNAMLDNAETTSVKRRDTWVMNIFKSWLEEKTISKEIDSQIQELQHFSNKDINDYLSKFIFEVRKKNGEYFPRESLIAIAAGLQNVIRKKRPGVNLFNSVETAVFTKALDASMKISTASLPPRNSTNHKPISMFDEEEILSGNVLTADNPDGLTRALFYLNGINFALRGGEEQTKLSVKQFRVETRNGMKCLIYSPKTGKTCNGGLKDKRRSAQERVYFYDENEKLNHIELFEKFLTLRPPNADRFYLYSKKQWKTSLYWYVDKPIGKNVISKMTTQICAEAGILEKRTNHSLRATCATRMFEGKVDEQIIMERTGHTSVMGVRTYKRTSDVLIKDSQVALHPNQIKVLRQPNNGNEEKKSNEKEIKFGNLYFSNCNLTNNFFTKD